ncbi:MAG: prepilin-type N-terminal cleavage/methylation domain-containing protein [Caldimicrobium sp.]
MRKREKKESGFTLIELIIVISIIAILASLAIPTYLKYQRKAKVSSYALPRVRECAMDLAAFCILKPGYELQSLDIDLVPNCKTVITPAGNVTLSIIPGTCTSSGVLNGTEVKGDLGPAYEYIAKCQFDAYGNIQCTIERR